MFTNFTEVFMLGIELIVGYYVVLGIAELVQRLGTRFGWRVSG